jgi:hypothetical protein
MTGEVTLTGRVLPIGGVKEKTLVAIRARCTDIILPALNRPDWDELAENIQQGITPHFVNHYDEVFAFAFEGYGELPQTELSNEGGGAFSDIRKVVCSITRPVSLGSCAFADGGGLILEREYSHDFHLQDSIVSSMRSRAHFGDHGVNL